MRTKEEAVKAIQPAPKLSPSQQQRMLNIQKRFEDITEEIFENVPDCADRTSGMRKLLDAKMTLVHAITHSPE